MLANSMGKQTKCMCWVVHTQGLLLCVGQRCQTLQLCHFSSLKGGSGKSRRYCRLGIVDAKVPQRGLLVSFARVGRMEEAERAETSKS